MNKKQTVMEIKKIFDIEYADAKCSLDFKTPLQLLISTQLAAQCTDVRVNLVTPALFSRYNDVQSFANADILELEEYIHSTGFYHNKAKNIISCCKRILEVYGGNVPDNMADLLTLAGVGRKTASIIIGDIYAKPAIVIDTHAKRLAYRIGLTQNTDPTKIEFDLQKILPSDYTFAFCHQLVYHGRAVCKAIKPRCDVCLIYHLCKQNIK